MTAASGRQDSGPFPLGGAFPQVGGGYKLHKSVG